jgi:hypothetical protein
MRRVNILADKSLLAAFIENTYYIKPQHVQAAIRDSELGRTRRLPGRRLLFGGAAASLLLLMLAAWRVMDSRQAAVTHDQVQPAVAAAVPAGTAQPVAQPSGAAPAPDSPPPPAATQAAAPARPMAGTNSATSPTPLPGNAARQPAAKAARSSPAPGKTSLFDQRLAAGKQLLEQRQAVASIQLFYNEEIKPQRIEGFLKRADKLGKLPEIYLLPADFGGKKGLRILYGAYPSVDAAHSAIKELPLKYQQAFATSTYIF